MNVKLKTLGAGAVFFLAGSMAFAQKNDTVTKTKDIDEVVVVAYGTQKKQSLVGAQTSIGAKELESRPISNVTNAISGKAPGVQILTSGGQPGSGSSIRIRGFGSINASSAPLIVVDGSIFNGAISDIPSQDVEAITILKDAASTALYGSSAGNGVVMITTKSGSRSKGKPSITFNSSLGFITKGQKDYDKVGVMDYYPLRWQQWYNQYKYDMGYDDNTAGLYASYDVNADLKYNPYSGIKSYYNELPDGSIVLTKNPQGASYWPAIVMADGKLNPEINGLLYGDDLNWEKSLFRTGMRSENSINGSFATDKLRSFMSLGYLSEDGYRIATKFERFTGRANVSYDANSWLSLGSNLSFSFANYTQPKRGSGSYSSNSFNFIRNIAPIYPIHSHNADGSYVVDDKGNYVYDYSRNRPYTGGFNPVLESLLDLSSLDRQSVNNRSFISIKLLPNLKFTSNLAYDMYQDMSKVRYNNIMGDQPNGLLTITNYKNQAITFNELLEYNKSFGNHKINVLAAHESYKYNAYTSSLSKKGMGWLGIDEADNFSEVDGVDSKTDKYRKEGFFGRLNYDYSNLYNLSFSYRRDGTSRLHKDYRWGNFWSVGAGWKLKNQSFLSDVNWLDNLSLRASYGQTGNDALSSYYAYQTTYGLGNDNYTSPGLRINSFGNQQLLWETQTSSDIALEFGLFNFVKGSVELFDKRSKDLIFAFPLPASTGIGSIDKNIGKVRNYGVELDLNFNIIKSQNFDWNVNWNGTILKNKILELPEANRTDGIEFSYHKYLEGTSIYDYYLNDWIGVNADTGKAMYRIDDVKYAAYADPNSTSFVGVSKTGEYAAYTYDASFAKKIFAGTSIPYLTGGFGTDFRIGRFDFGANFVYQLGGKTYDGAYQSLMGRSLNGGRAMHVDMLKAWQKPGDITDVPRLDAGTSGLYDATTSDRFLISSTALMFKSAVINYSLPQDLISNLGVNSIKVGVSGENLFLWSKRKGLNPMSNYSGAVGSAFYDFARTVTANLSVTF